MPLLQDMLPTSIYSYMAARFLSEPKVETGDCDTYCTSKLKEYSKRRLVFAYLHLRLTRFIVTIFHWLHTVYMYCTATEIFFANCPIPRCVERPLCWCKWPPWPPGQPWGCSARPSGSPSPASGCRPRPAAGRSTARTCTHVVNKRRLSQSGFVNKNGK